MKIWIMSRLFLVLDSNGNVGLKLDNVAVGLTICSMISLQNTNASGLS